MSQSRSCNGADRHFDRFYCSQLDLVRTLTGAANFDWQDSTLSNQLCSSALCTTSVVSECNKLHTRIKKSIFCDVLKVSQGGFQLMNLIGHLHHAWPVEKNREPSSERDNAPNSKPLLLDSPASMAGHSGIFDGKLSHAAKSFLNVWIPISLEPLVRF